MSESYLLNAQKALISLFEATYHIEDVALFPIANSGSNRLYFRLEADTIKCIGTFVPDAVEGECFVRLAQDFYKYGQAVPKIYAVSPDFHCYLQEDLGDKSLFSSLREADVEILVKDTLVRLVDLQKTPERVWSSDCMNKSFSRRQAFWDLNYFKYEYLKPRNVNFDEDKLEDDFEKLATRLVDVPDEFCGFMMRDCQSRNVMITPSGPVFIDFQGGRRGPAIYDAVSLLWQARAAFSSEFRNSMLEFYSLIFCDGDTDKKNKMLSIVNEMVLFRTLQVLGAYGFRGLVEQKSHFLLSIPGALANLNYILEQGVLDAYSELKRVSSELVVDKLFCRSQANDHLVVEIFSFSYKKGYPNDLSGNGGGFMFDCRAMHNPGRYREYKNLTGKDRAVIEFLEERGEVQPFLQNAWSLADPAIERYINRGFTHIQIGFGCTGGQHRSVYCAELTAIHVGQLFPEAEIKLIHREQPSLK